MSAACALPDPQYSATLAPMQILVVEDERRQREYMVDILSANGTQVVSASTAHEAIRMAAQLRPAVIILDGLLPGMHGFEVARFIRALDPSYRPRIVMMTAIYKHMRYQNEAKLKYGIDDYLVKPINEEQLNGIVRSARSAQMEDSHA